jgi:hypothetical protein
MEKEIKFKFTSDPSKLNKDLDDAQKKAEGTEKSAQRAGTSIGDAVRTLAGAIAGAKIIGFFREAVAESAKLEQALAKVTATARAFKQSTSQAKQAAVELAQDGFLTVTQSAQTLSNLMAVGLNLDQAKKFIVASKDVTSFGNTIGDAGQAVSDLSLGLLRGSALVIDNASPALKSLANKYQSLVDTQGKAKAAQYAFNEVTKVASKYTGDAARYMDTLTGATARFNAVTDKAKASIGDALAPALKSLYSAMSDVVEGFTKWFSALRGPQQTIGVLTVGLVALVPVIYAVNGALALLAVNPVVLTIMAIVAAIGAVVLAAEALYNSLKPGRGENLMDQKKAQEDEIKLLALNKKHSVELANAKERLKKINEEITESYGDLLKQYKLENAAYETKLNFIRRIDEAERNLGGNARIRGLSNSELEAEMAELIAANARARRAPSSVLSSAQREYMMGNTTAEINILRREKARRAAHPETPGTVAHDAPVVVNKYSETRFLDAAEKLKKIEGDKNFTIRKAGTDPGLSLAERARRIKNAQEDARIMSENELTTMRESLAQYNEDKYRADIEAARKSKESALKIAGELNEAERKQAEIVFDERKKLAHGNAALIADARKKYDAEVYDAEQKLIERNNQIKMQNAKNEFKAFTESAGRTLAGANTLAGGIGALSKATDAGGGFKGAGGVVSGISGLSSSLGFLGPAGAGIGAAGALISTVAEFFGDSAKDQLEANKKNHEESIRKAEERKKILEAQAAYLKSINELQIAQAAVPFKVLQNDLRLIDLTNEQNKISGAGLSETALAQQKLSLVVSTLNESIAKISEGNIGGGITNGQGVTDLLNFDLKFGGFVSTVKDLMDQSRAVGYSNDALRDELSRQTAAIINSQLGTNANYTNFRAVLTDLLQSGTATADQTQLAKLFYAVTQNDRTNYTEYRADLARAQDTLSLLEMQNTLQAQVAKNTAATALALEPDRLAAFIDIAGGGLRQFGGFLSGTPLTLSDQAAALSVSSVAASAAQKNDIEL